MMSILLECVSTLCMKCLQWPEEGVMVPGAGVIEDCQLPYVCSEPNLSPLKEQQELLVAEPSL